MSSSDPDAKRPGADAPGAAPSDAGGAEVPSSPGAEPSGRSVPNDVPAGASGSVDVALSGPLLPASDGTPTAVASYDSEPVSTGKIKAATAGDHARSGGKRIADGVRVAIDGGVTKLGSGIGTIGEGVTKLGEKSRKVPLVGAGVSRLGEGITTVGESLSELPRVARTRRGRLLVRSVVVSFVLVFAWIGVIVALQVRGIDAPDFRPNAERVLVALSSGSAAIGELYEQASPRFQEMVRKDRFVDDMLDMNATVGKFVEIAAINDSLVSNGPTGRVGRVSLTVAYEHGTTKASVSLHWDQGKWKLLGVGIEVPPELKITQAQREQRVQACKDPMDSKKCDLFVAANRILEQLRDGHADQVWDDATKVFQKQEEKARFVALQVDHAAALGPYRRIIRVSEAKAYSNATIGTFDIVTEYAKSQGVRAIFGFYRAAKTAPWKLRSLKVVIPMPRADESPAPSSIEPAGPAKPPAPRVAPPEPRPVPPRTGSGSATGSGSSADDSSAAGIGSGSAAATPADPPAGSSPSGSASPAPGADRGPK